MQTGMCMMGSGLKTKLKVLANTCTLMDLFTKGIGSMINKMGRAKKNGLMGLHTRVST